MLPDPVLVEDVPPIRHKENALEEYYKEQREGTVSCFTFESKHQVAKAYSMSKTIRATGGMVNIRGLKLFVTKP